MDRDGATPGLGLVAEVDLLTGERLELIQVLDAPL